MINLIISDTKRSLNYIKEILKNDICINKIILYSIKNGLVSRFIKKEKIEKLLVICKTKNINSPKILKKLELYKSNLNIMSTYPGEIVKNYKLFKKGLLHAHSGDLPKFKGSTTIYYSIILKKKICVTLILLNKEIDEGKIVYKKYFKNPKNLDQIEKNFDDNIRAKTLVDYLKNKKKFKIKKTNREFLHYNIAHPIIRHLVLKNR